MANWPYAAVGTWTKRRCWVVLRSEIPSGTCAKLRTAAASNNRDHASQSLILLLARPTHIYCFSSRTSRSWWITLSTQRHRRGCNSSNSWICWVLRRWPSNGDGKSFLERWHWTACSQTPLAWHYSFRALLFHITHHFFDYDYDTSDYENLQNFCSRHRVGPRKSSSKRAQLLIRPALAAGKDKELLRWFWNEAYITIWRDNKLMRPIQLRIALLLFFLSVSDYKRLALIQVCISLSSPSTQSLNLR